MNEELKRRIEQEIRQETENLKKGTVPIDEAARIQSYDLPTGDPGEVGPLEADLTQKKEDEKKPEAAR